MYSRDPQAMYWQDQAQLWIPQILGALAILVVAYILARAAKWAISKIVDRVPALKRHYEAEPGKTLGSPDRRHRLLADPARGHHARASAARPQSGVGAGASADDADLLLHPEPDRRRPYLRHRPGRGQDPPPARRRRAARRQCRRVAAAVGIAGNAGAAPASPPGHGHGRAARVDQPHGGHARLLHRHDPDHDHGARCPPDPGHLRPRDGDASDDLRRASAYRSGRNPGRHRLYRRQAGQSSSSSSSCRPPASTVR